MIKQPTVFPPNKTWNQPNTGYLFGSIYQTQNVSMDVAGVISLSKRGQYIGREDDSSSTYDHLLSVNYDGQSVTGAERYYLLTSDSLYRMTQGLGSFQIDPTASMPSFSLASSDAVIWTDGLYCSTTSNVSKLSASAWTGSQMSFSTSGIPHPLCASASANYLLGGNGNILRQKDPSTGTVTTALTLPANYRIQWIRSDYSRTLLGCRNMNGGDTAVFEWDEVSPTWTNKYDIDASWVLSGCFRNTDFFTVTNDGRLLKFNGGGFSTVAQFPIYKTLEGYWANGFTLSTVYQRGMQVIEGRVNILLAAEIDNAGEAYPNFPSGIWEFDESTGLNHKYGVSFTQTSDNFSSNLFGSGAGALGSVVVDPVSGGPDSGIGGTLIYGARLDTGNSTLGYYVCGSIVSDGVNRGSFVTTRVETSDVADDAKKLWVKFRGLFTSDDKILFKVKERVISGLPTLINGYSTWTSTTVFTTASADVAQWALAEVGYEITVQDGFGGGATAHITSISAPVANVYTITVDEAIPGIVAGYISKMNVDNFRKLETSITSADEQPYKGIPLEQEDASDWVQIKVEMRGSYLVTIEELQLVSASHELPTV